MLRSEPWRRGRTRSGKGRASRQGRRPERQRQARAVPASMKVNIYISRHLTSLFGSQPSSALSIRRPERRATSWKAKPRAVKPGAPRGWLEGVESGPWGTPGTQPLQNPPQMAAERPWEPSRLLGVPTTLRGPLRAVLEASTAIPEAGLCHGPRREG